MVRRGFTIMKLRSYIGLVFGIHVLFFPRVCQGAEPEAITMPPRLVLTFDVSGSVAYSYVSRDAHSRALEYLQVLILRGWGASLVAPEDEVEVIWPQLMSRPLWKPGATWCAYTFGADVLSQVPLTHSPPSPGWLEMVYPVTFRDPLSDMAAVLTLLGALREGLESDAPLYWIFVSDDIPEYGSDDKTVDDRIRYFHERFSWDTLFSIRISSKGEYRGKPAFLRLQVRKVYSNRHHAEADIDSPAGISDFGRDVLRQRIETLRNLVKNNPEDAEAHVLLANALLRRGDPAERDLYGAGENYKQAVVLSSESLDAHIGLSRVLLAIGELSIARQSIEIAVNLNPTQLDAQFVFAQILSQSGEGARAIEILEKLLEAGGSREIRRNAYYLLAKLYATHSSKPRLAVQVCSRALQEDPGNIEVRFLRSILYGLLARYRQAIEDLDYVAENAPDTHYRTIAAALSEQYSGKKKY